MRDWGFVPGPEELAAVRAAADAFRARWESIRPPFHAAFDGSLTDIHALDFMTYEGINLPPGGIESAALVCGEVLRRAADLEWVISYRGDWFVASPELRDPNIAICPFARLHEIECGGPRGSGMYAWFIQKAAFDCLLRGETGTEREPALRALMEDAESYLGRVEWLLDRLGRPLPPGPRRRRRRW
jgi:hypothetical protein